MEMQKEMQNFPEDGIFQQWQFHYFLVLAFVPAVFQAARMKLSLKKNLSTFYCSFSWSILFVSSFFVSLFSILIRLQETLFSLLRHTLVCNFKSLSYCFKETIGLGVKASFESRPVFRLIRWYNKPDDITKEFW